MGSEDVVKYDVDIVFCIDATENAGDVIGKFKNGIVNVYQNVTEYMEHRGRLVDNFRVRIIAFRDYLFDDKDAMLVSGFFKLPQEVNILNKCLDSLVAKGGGDDPDDGLEALAYAIRFKWNNDGLRKRRHIIVLLTNDDTHSLGFGKCSNYYPKGMAVDLNELTSWWGSLAKPGYMDQQAKRLVLFAPEKPGWRQITECWDNTVQIPFLAHNGLDDITYKEILTCIFDL